MGVHILIDSGADLDLALCQKENITLVPLRLIFGSSEYRDRVDITPMEFYEKLIECDDLPTTSMASVYDFQTALAPIVGAGDQALIITISSKLSGTYQSACIAAADYPGQVFVVDSLNVSIGAQVLVELALRLAKQGLSAQAIAQILEQKRENVCVLALLDTLEYLKRGGRISKTVAFAGGVLGIKPVVTVHDGEVSLLGKARGSKKGNNLLVEYISAAGGIDFSLPSALGYTGLTDTLLQKYLEDSADLWRGQIETIPTVHIGSCIGTHVGPGAIAVAFFAANNA
jgi:DegV family protein with EDD domain